MIPLKQRILLHKSKNMFRFLVTKPDTRVGETFGYSAAGLLILLAVGGLGFLLYVFPFIMAAAIVVVGLAFLAGRVIYYFTDYPGRDMER